MLSSSPVLTMTRKIPRMRDIKLPGVTKNGLALLYCPEVLPEYNAREYFLGTENPRRVKIEHAWDQMPKDRLNWFFVTATAGLQMACMRVRYKRQWSTAFAQALKQNGFGHDGRKLPAAPCEPREPGLKGTFEVRIFSSMSKFDGDFDKKLQICNNMVRGLGDFIASGQTRPEIRKFSR